MYEKNTRASFDGLGRYFGQPNPDEVINESLPVSVAVDTQELSQKMEDPRKYIPTPTAVVDWMGARKYLKRPRGSAPRVQPITKMGIDVYWTTHGPKFSKVPVAAGATAEKVSRPEPTWIPSVSVVRDRPHIDLPPIVMPTGLQGLGESATNPRCGLAVLGLIIVGILLYRRK